MHRLIRSLLVIAFFAPGLTRASTSDRFMVEAQSILDEIKLANKHRNGYASVFFGVMQIATPQVEDPILLNSQSMVPVIGLEGDLRIWKEWGFTFKFTHAQNIIFPTDPSSLNSTSAYQQMLEACIRYKFILDETNIKNFVLVKLGSYTMRNNFLLQSDELAYMNTMTGLQLGVERSIPATPQFDIKGGLDVFYIFDSTSLTDIGFSKSGSGFQFKGEIFYNFKLFGAPARWGGSYTLDVFYNRLLNQQDQNKTSLVQSYRTLATILSLVY